LIRLAIRCRRDEAEAALAELLELAPGGVEEVDAPGGENGVVEYAVYGAPGELPDIGALQAAAGDALVEVRSEHIPDDWSDRWKRFYHPTLIGGRLYVRPPWERPADRGGVIEVVIDPGRAFGTGTHATTNMCLELLLDVAPTGGLQRLLRRGRRSFCDLGCGSGILAIAAAKLGLRPVLAVDSEQAAIEECGRNAHHNYVDVSTERVDLRRENPPAADVVTANLTAGLLTEIAERWAAGAPATQTLIASGFLTSESDRIGEALVRAGFREKRSMRKGEWSAVLAEATSRQRSAPSVPLTA
jgi:ribosomal protein L11 methyltransferase